MKVRRLIAIGSLAFSVWRGYRRARSTVRTQARSTLKRALKAI